jgi:hypothetical protein
VLVTVALLMATPSSAQASDLSPLVPALVALFGGPLLLLGIALTTLRHPLARVLVHLIGVIGWLLAPMILATIMWPGTVGVAYALVLALFTWIAWVRQRPY